jgi:hypothetical protein
MMATGFGPAMHLAGAVMIAMAIADASPALPERGLAWSAKTPPSRYDAETIFRYIDGQAEVYLAYGMVNCRSRRYEGPPGEGAIVLDVFEMGSAADAYGVFTHSRAGAAVEVGQDGTFGYGTLLFWKGRHFVSVQAEEESEPAREALMALGRAVEATIAETGERPALVGQLPPDGLRPDSIVYLRHPQILGAHLHLGPGNPMGVGPAAPAVLARYARDGSGGDLVLVDYPSATAANLAVTSFSRRFLDRGAPARRDDGWYATARVAGAGHVRAFVVRAASREAALALLADAERGGRR